MIGNTVQTSSAVMLFQYSLTTGSKSSRVHCKTSDTQEPKGHRIASAPPAYMAITALNIRAQCENEKTVDCLILSPRLQASTSSRTFGEAAYVSTAEPLGPCTASWRQHVTEPIGLSISSIRLSLSTLIVAGPIAAKQNAFGARSTAEPR